MVWAFALIFNLFCEAGNLKLGTWNLKQISQLPYSFLHLKNIVYVDVPSDS